MGGKAIKNVRPLVYKELKPTYEWVERNILPLLGLNKYDAKAIGSFQKKPLTEKYGDIDVALDAQKFIKEGLEFEEIATAINFILEEAGLETTLLKGFDQVSIKVPIAKTNEYAQVDLMPIINLEWGKFMYHSPNIKENESKYKGAVRNALLMAIISESTKEVNKLFEGQAEEYNSLAIRFPTGIWNIKRSFMGKRGKLVKKGTILESEFLTDNPQDVVDLAFGSGYGIGSLNSFETIWEMIHRKDFIHKKILNEIMSKFKVNLKSMMQDIPREALIKYPYLSEEFIGHFGDTWDPVGLYKNPKSIKRFGPNIKAILDLDGNIYMEDIPEDWLHKDMAEKLKAAGKLPYSGNFYDQQFVTLMRIGSTNEFGITEGTEKDITTIITIDKANKKHPYKIHAKHYEDVKPDNFSY